MGSRWGPGRGDKAKKSEEGTKWNNIGIWFSVVCSLFSSTLFTPHGISGVSSALLPPVCPASEYESEVLVVSGPIASTTTTESGLNGPKSLLSWQIFAVSHLLPLLSHPSMATIEKQLFFLTPWVWSHKLKSFVNLQYNVLGNHPQSSIPQTSVICSFSLHNLCRVRVSRVLLFISYLSSDKCLFHFPIPSTTISAKPFIWCTR